MPSYQIPTTSEKGMLVMVEAVLKCLVQISYEIHVLEHYRHFRIGSTPFFIKMHKIIYAMRVP
jgi:hypothetical protein